MMCGDMRKMLAAVFSLTVVSSAAAVAQEAPRAETPEAAAAYQANQEKMSQGGFGPSYYDQLEAQKQAEAARAEEAKKVDRAVLAVPSGNDTVDYKGIANALFAQPEKEVAKKNVVYQDEIITLTEPTQKLTLGMGHTADLKVRTAPNLKWNYDKEFTSLEFLSDREEDGFQHAVYKAKAPGEETIYFDCLDLSDPTNVKVLETKMIVIKVEE